MAEKMELFVTRSYTVDGQEKTRWSKIGVAFRNRTGDGWTLMFDAAPLGDGKVAMMPPKDWGDKPQRARPVQAKPVEADAGPDDDLPF